MWLQHKALREQTLKSGHGSPFRASYCVRQDFGAVGALSLEGRNFFRDLPTTMNDSQDRRMDICTVYLTRQPTWCLSDSPEEMYHGRFSW